jgi:hypothetical protein
LTHVFDQRLFGDIFGAGVDDVCRDGNPPGFTVASDGADGLRLAILELERGLI